MPGPFRQTEMYPGRRALLSCHDAPFPQAETACACGAGATANRGPAAAGSYIGASPRAGRSPERNA